MTPAWTADGGRLPVISEPQARALLAIGGGQPITLRELARALDRASINGRQDVHTALRARGLVAMEARLSRTLRLTALGADFVAGLRSLEVAHDR